RLAHLPFTAELRPAEVARTGTSVFIEDPGAYVGRYAAALAAYGVSADPRAIAAVPLEVDGRAVGVLGVFWHERHALPPDRQAFIAALARLGASAMERGRLFDAERAALRRAEAAQRRLNLIGEAGRILAMSLDFDVIIDRLAGLGLPDMGDACVVEIP